MFFHILNIIAPVFLVIIAGYLAVNRKLLTDSMIDGLMKFALLIAIPCLLFKATSGMNLSTAFDWRLILAFYGGSTASFALACFISYKFFGRPPGESVAIGFGGLFSNLVLLGLPISERAWGLDQLEPIYAIVAIHAPYNYLLGITTMELLRSDGRSIADTAQVVIKAMFRNSLMIGIGLGLLVNFSGLTLPSTITDAIDLLTRAALPAALFGLGGVLTRYKLSDSLGAASSTSMLSLFAHPLIALGICYLLGVEDNLTRMVVLVAAMSPGLNSYLFAVLYERGQGTAANLVLLGTVTAVFSISFWLWLLT
uniref:Malonate transporter n=1 Tax=uncultured Thiotrichaceae bacterium TaxID=298394 RepID=A0A6S6TEA0_9GAMM|nr:MAG: malonate transporter [uncultured Thiotrichaceae bacterium]